MSADEAPRRGQQRSVAELLAAYSAESRPPPRRRRRADEDDAVDGTGAPPTGYARPAGYAPTAEPGYGSNAPGPSGYGPPGYGPPGSGAPEYGSSGHGSSGHGATDYGSAGYPGAPYGPRWSGPGAPGYGTSAQGASGYGSGGDQDPQDGAGFGGGRLGDGRLGDRGFGDGGPRGGPGAPAYGPPGSSAASRASSYPGYAPPPDAYPDHPRGIVPAPPASAPPSPASGYGATDPTRAGTGYYPGYGTPPGRSPAGHGRSGAWYGTEPPAPEAYADAPDARPAFGTPAVPPVPAARPAGAPEPRRASDGGPPTAGSPMDLDDLDDDWDDEDAADVVRTRRGVVPSPTDRPAGLGRDRRDRAAEDDADDEFDDLDDHPDVSGGGAREWIVMIGQLVLGALVGAVLWTVFSFLWQKLPVVALFLAAAATTGLVFGVRTMRRSDDLQTTVWAVVVGLVVTVSPAAFVLLSKG